MISIFRDQRCNHSNAEAEVDVRLDEADPLDLLTSVYEQLLLIVFLFP